MKKKLVSALLAVVLLMSVTTTAFAAAPVQPEKPTVTTMQSCDDLPWMPIAPPRP